MGKPKYGSHIGKPVRPPRQTRWYRKNIRRERVIPDRPGLDLNADEQIILECDSDKLSDTGNVLSDEDWDVSSVSSTEESPPSFSDDSYFSEEFSDSQSDFENLEPISPDIPICAGLQITQRESIQLIAAFAKKANLTRECTDELLKLIKLHLPSGVNYPTSSFKLQKFLQVPEMPCYKYLYCDNCEIVLSNLVCNKCKKVFQEKEVVSAGNYFLLYDIREQITIMLNNENIKAHVTNEILFRSRMSDEEKELHYGKKYCNIIEGWNLSATINTDGVPVFKSSKVSIWPVLFALNELPYNVRKRAIIIGALWFGSKKINVQMVFSMLITELKQFHEQGIFWTNSLGDVVLSYVFFQKVSVDAIASCIVQGITQFNGVCGCNYCKDEGVVVAKGRGRCRVYMSVKNLNLRTDANHREIILSGKFDFGIKCPTPFLDLKHFDVISGFPVEPMHNVFLGVAKMIFNLWFTLKRSDCYLGNTDSRNTINSRLLNCKVTSEIVRTVRPIETLKHWKASEFRSLIFIMALVTADLLPRAYHKHFCKFANSIYYLSQPNLDSEKLPLCKKNLQQFVQNVPNLYGDEYMSYNIHLLLHIVQSCIDFGPLWQFSAFMFESFNAVLLKYISTANSIPLQLSKKFSNDFQTRFVAQSCFQNKDASVMFSHLSKAPKCLQEMFRVKKPYLKFSPDEPIMVQCTALARIGCIFKSRKAIINGHLFKAYETQKRADCYVRVDINHIGKVAEFLKVKCNCETPCDCHTELALVEIFRVSKLPFIDFGFKCDNNVRRIKRVIPIRDLTNHKFMKLEYDNCLYFLHICNLFEID